MQFFANRKAIEVMVGERQAACQRQSQSEWGFENGACRQKLPGRQFGEAYLVVGGISRTGVSGPAPRSRAGAGRSFNVKADRVAQPDAAVATQGIAVVSLLALQEAESGLQQDREAKQHGEAVIDELVELQHAMLGEGGLDLDRLASLVARPITASDPGLAGLLRAVRVRAGIELARRGRAASM